MKTSQQSRPTNGAPLWLRVLGVLLALQLLGAITLQFAPELHHDLHDPAHAPDHTCLITLLRLRKPSFPSVPSREQARSRLIDFV